MRQYPNWRLGTSILNCPAAIEETVGNCVPNTWKEDRRTHLSKQQKSWWVASRPWMKQAQKSLLS